MDQQTIVFLSLMVIFAVWLAGYLSWKTITDVRAKRIAHDARQHVSAQGIVIFDILRSRYGTPTFILEFTNDDGSKFRKTFNPRSLSSEISSLSVNIGDHGKFYAVSLGCGSPAWLEVGTSAFWGRMAI
jgi:hypothetical protein